MAVVFLLVLDDDFHLFMGLVDEVIKLTEEEREGVISNVRGSFNLDIDREGIFFLIEREVVIDWEVI